MSEEKSWAKELAEGIGCSLMLLGLAVVILAFYYGEKIVGACN